MARKRMVGPNFFTHPELYECELESKLPCRLAYEGLWTQADRRGIFQWRPQVLKLAILPYDPIDFGAVLDALWIAGFIVKYEVAGKCYGIIPTFSSHQTFHRDEKPSSDPEPSAGTVLTPGQHSADTVSNCRLSVAVTSTVATQHHTPRASARENPGEPMDPLEAVSGYAGLAARLSPAGKAALDGYCRAARMPLGVVAAITGLQEQEGYDWPTISQALVEYSAKDANGTLSTEGLRSFCRKIKKRPYASPKNKIEQGRDELAVWADEEREREGVANG